MLLLPGRSRRMTWLLPPIHTPLQVGWALCCAALPAGGMCVAAGGPQGDGCRPARQAELCAAVHGHRTQHKLY